MNDILEIAVSEFENLSIQWAEQDGEARQLEKMEKIIFSELVNQSNETSVARAEHWARDHRRYRDHAEKTVVARTIANVTKAKVSAKEMRFEAWRTQQATRRAEINLR